MSLGIATYGIGSVFYTVKEVYSHRVSGLGSKHVIQVSTVEGTDIKLWKNEEYQVKIA